jgi:hypothetical protein
MLFRIEQQNAEAELRPKDIAKMWLALSYEEQEPYLLQAQEMGAVNDSEKQVASSGAYSTGAGKYRKGRGKARIWSDEEVRFPAEGAL